ncbi:UDP-glucose/GDP-mannose dehydrogenase family protein [Paenibacillus sediminis]|uniref:UDP-glucose 6-dehydrogenase n=1 Tax=Paenibacillus sediminis TaxID=664909 RepID=A0ABS4H6D3_9BACL|nr:UDP-glucose/GDP-mannose dehydrogenase family protein [Paenibacillus sediminis]MBP1938103.1 UDPglucose 6-dehydrogenase [Paenibacillus sediminis]
MKVVCIGSGYVGTVTGAAFAALGHRTTVIDIDLAKVKLINGGKSPFFEPGLDKLMLEMVNRQLLSATTTFDEVYNANIVFIAVGTPSREDGTADLEHVKAAARNIGEHLNPDQFTVIVNKSTVPVGTSDLVGSILEETSGLRINEHFAVVSNPEFLREGFALEDVFFPDRIVVGTNHSGARTVMSVLYHHIIERVNYGELFQWIDFKVKQQQSPTAVYFETDTKSAEMIKYVSNAFLAIKISYVNEVARLCEALGANVLDVARGMGLDSRIGEKFLQVSSGWSGSCFPKDTTELLETGRKYRTDLTLVRAAIDSNNNMLEACVDKIKRRLKTLNGKNIGILGLTFKPNTDDARHTQSSYIIERLIKLGANVKAHDPKGMDKFRTINEHLQVRYCDNPEDVAERADAIVLMTHWDEYAKLNWQLIGQKMRNPYLLDTRNFLVGNQMNEIGFTYEGNGI